MISATRNKDSTLLIIIITIIIKKQKQFRQATGQSANYKRQDSCFCYWEVRSDRSPSFFGFGLVDACVLRLTYLCWKVQRFVRNISTKRDINYSYKSPTQCPLSPSKPKSEKVYKFQWNCFSHSHWFSPHF